MRAGDSILWLLLPSGKMQLLSTMAKLSGLCQNPGALIQPACWEWFWHLLHPAFIQESAKWPEPKPWNVLIVKCFGQCWNLCCNLVFFSGHLAQLTQASSQIYWGFKHGAIEMLVGREFWRVSSSASWKAQNVAGSELMSPKGSCRDFKISEISFLWAM